MPTPNTELHAAARASLLAFLRRTFTQLAVRSEKDAKAFRAMLKGLT
jgi:hypothetical protein